MMRIAHLKHISLNSTLVTNRAALPAASMEIRDMLLATFAIFFAMLGWVAWEDLRSDASSLDA